MHLFSEVVTDISFLCCFDSFFVDMDVHLCLDLSFSFFLFFFVLNPRSPADLGLILPTDEELY